MSASGLSEAQVNALYQQYLGRAPEAGVAAQWGAAGGAKESDLANALGQSQEFGQRAMADPTRVFTPGNVNAPTGARGNLTQEQLNAQYREILGRDAPASDLAAWNNVGGSINDYRNALIATPEFGERYGDLRRSLSPDDPRLNPVGFNPAAARQSPAFTQTVGGQPIASPALPSPVMPTQPTMPTNRDSSNYTWTSNSSAALRPGMGGGQPDWLGGILGQLFGADRMRGGMGSGTRPTTPNAPPGYQWERGSHGSLSLRNADGDYFDFDVPMGPSDGPDWSRMTVGPKLTGGGALGGAMPRNNQFTDLFGASPGQFGSGAVTGQQTSAMSNPLSASPFGRNYSTRRSMPQMGIPTRGLV